jgi:hypothetical protein
MPATDEDVLRYANQSGFPLQIGLQHAVDAAKNLIPWRVRYVEHGWVHPESLGSGYIDLVLQAYGARQHLVIESKRKADTDWVFMHSSGKVSDRRHAKVWVTEATGGNVRRHGWANCQVDGPCPEADFCVVRGQGMEDREPMLERIAGQLVLATEALAHAERDFRSPTMPYVRAFTSVLVTTATLSVVEFDPASVSLADGKIPTGNVRRVPWLRLRKQLATRFVRLTSNDFAAGGDPSYSMENTVFVVQAASLVAFLQDYELQLPQ